MKKRWNVLILTLLLMASGCAKLLIPPHIQTVKKMAVLSIYMNKNFYNIKAPKANEGMNFLKSLAKDKLGIKDKNMAEHQLIITYALKEYTEKLNSIDNWVVLSPLDLMGNSKYQAFLKSDGKGFMHGLLDTIRKAEENKWAVPDKMRYIPISSVVKAGNVHTYGNVKDPLAEMRKNLGELCKELKVDAVAIIELDMAYKTGMQFGGGILGSGTKIKPNISSAMVVITKDGEVAVKSPLIAKGGGTRYKAKGAFLKIEEGTVTLRQKDGKGVQAFNAAVEQSAIGLKESIVTAFSKLK
ncbi:hypothetical protein ACFLTD_01965 [Elusimicrobiota bacterium]